MKSFCRKSQLQAPGGFDIIIDDASHIGELTKTTFWHLFDHHLKPGGLYAIEDWGTGYLDDFSDGKKIQSEVFDSRSRSVSAAATFYQADEGPCALSFLWDGRIHQGISRRTRGCQRRDGPQNRLAKIKIQKFAYYTRHRFRHQSRAHSYRVPKSRSCSQWSGQNDNFVEYS